MAKFGDLVRSELEDGESYLLGATVRWSADGGLTHVRGSLESEMYVGLTDKRLFLASHNLKRVGSFSLDDLHARARATYRRDALARPILSIWPTDPAYRGVLGARGMRLTFGYRDRDKWQRICTAVGAQQAE